MTFIRRFDIIQNMRNKKLIALVAVVTALVITIITCGATFLVRHVETYNYYVDSPDEYDQKVVDASGIKLNSSMFFIDEVGVKANIENAYFDVEVINIERRFPDRVSINYIVHDSAFSVVSGTEYLLCYASGRIGNVLSVTGSRPAGYFEVRPKSAVQNEKGGYFQDPDGFDYKTVKKFIECMQSYRFRAKQIASVVDFIDLRREDSLNTYMFIKLSEGSAIELHCRTDRFETRFESLFDDAWSIYSDPRHVFTDPETGASITVSPSKGLIRVYETKPDTDKPEIKHTYSETTDVETYYRDNYL